MLLAGLNSLTSTIGRQLICAVVVMSLATITMADEIDPAAKALSDKSNAAIKAITDVTYHVTQSMESNDKNETSRGEVSLTTRDPNEGFPFDKYRVVIHNEEHKPTLAYAFDGETMQKLIYADKKLLNLKSSEGSSFPPQETSDLLPSWMFVVFYPQDGLKLVSAKLLDDTTSDGTPCKVVETIEQSESDMNTIEDGKAVKKTQKFVLTTRRTIAASDSLPRHIDMTAHFSNTDDAEGQKYHVICTMTKFKANSGLKPADFALKAPEGFATEEGKPADFGIQDDDGGGQPELKVKVGDDAPPFALKDADGKEHTLASLKGRVVLLDFWATWCGPCVKAMPHIQALHEKFSGKPVTIMGVNTWEKNSADAVEFMKSKGYTYTCLLGGDDLATAYGVPGIPTLVVIDGDGKVLSIDVGLSGETEKKLEATIEGAIKSAGK